MTDEESTTRRRALAGLGAAGVVGLGGAAVWLADRGRDPDGLPLRVETLAAPGSSAGETLVPVPDRPTVVDLFATWCGPCDEQVAELAAVRAEFPETAFLSVTNERPGGSLSRADIVDWWARHDGAWTLGLDPGSEALTAFGATGLPFLAFADSDGAVVDTHQGVLSADALRTRLTSLE